MNNTTQIVKIISGRTSYKIINELIKNPDYTINLAQKFKIESSIVTHALKKLEKNGIIKGNRKGKLKYYELTNKRVIQCLFRDINELNKRV